MRARRWFGLGWFALSALTAGCESGDADSCGGPTSDFPYCGDEDQNGGLPDDGVGAEAPAVGDPIDLDGDGQSDGRAVDTDGDGEADGVDTDGDGAAEAPLPPVPDGGVCAASPPPCDGVVIPLGVQGSSGHAELAINSVALQYITADAPQTLLTFLGAAAGEPIAIEAPLAARSSGAKAEVVPAGTYEGTELTTFRVLSCEDSSPLEASVEVFEHEEVGITEPSGLLRGVLRVSETGWSLEVPFEISQACARRSLVLTD